MTQLMLFDAPASVSVATPVTTAPDKAPAADNPRVSNSRSGHRGGENRRRRVERSADEKGGVHHMGDLARLVLMRYEMVARRRAALAQRRARCAG